ncbi:MULTISPECIES: NAD(P)-dependent oxidoreductase [unclassified Chelatococcus]|uniref:NAD-dependent epimerase/dehydratase family protein n=1 Tax=unclassified Chelatococcus TaxID=2638111 RepID=UPI001BD0237A|nr:MULTISPECIES: NAD(P)-dependent oxidoreductase [unclassified Chelatococcus]CAH1661145.1 UDP-glucose 4-epimerase [Hyphomicrobiales bacterium]MBS7741219.1 NAD(P)-dependent oxidoreductase [Chelatococcus sp. HY11]MBX3545405.1 NAD(P)-dependent oxidoreductase [Chelatococcus sp.]MCO5078041.1 NAD(P)-dependent oxidoreductase [Chelatococcus sp.]CAH1683190.1 UDP-glucose 4-epimerase [Hyphomicrobiales bacterium]
MGILITGGGVVGLRTAALLAARGERVVIVDVRQIRSDTLGGGVETATCDVVDRDGLTALVEANAITSIIHTAALLSTAIRRDPVRGVMVNTVGTTNVLEIARSMKLRRVVIASSTTVGYTGFSTHGPDPIEEDIQLRVVSQRPASIYAATKLAAENIALLYNDLYDVDVAVLRYGAVLSASQDIATSVPDQLLSTLMSAGRAGMPVHIKDPFLLWAGREEFVDARDCARANIAALDASELKSRVYNIATGAWYSFEDVCDVVRGIYPDLSVDLGVNVTSGFAGFPHMRPAPSSTAAAKRELGFTAAYRLEDTVSQLALPA